MIPCVSSGHRVFWVSIPEKFKTRLWVPITVKKCHDFYKGKYLVRAGLECQVVGLLSAWQEAWQHMGRHDAGGAESSIFKPSNSRKREPLGLAAVVELPRPVALLHLPSLWRKSTERKPQAAGSNQEKNKPRIDLLLLLLRWVGRRREIYLPQQGLSWYFPVKNTLQITLELLFRNH